MSVKELLIPRYKVIADYPNSDFKVGNIEDRDWCKYEDDDEETGVVIWKISDFPHLFRKLEWYEERDEEDMPEYVKTFYDYGDKIPYQYFKIERWDMGNVRGIINKINRKVITLNGLVKPCSEQEYLNYINKTNENK